MSKKSKLVLVDTPAIIHRAFHAIPHLTTKSGQPVNAIYGFSMIFLNMLRDLKPDYVAACFDVKEPTFRHKEFKEYKAKRIKAPQELYDQIPKIKEILTALNIPIFEKIGFEADDLIGTLSEKAQNKVDEIIIVTGDLDTLQLINPKTKVYTMRKGLTDTMIYDKTAVQERYNLKPEQLIDYKTLRGDPSDNIPGIAGIGEKTASDLISQFGSIEKVFQNLDKLSSRQQQLFKNKEKEIELSKKLVTIEQNVPVKFTLNQCDFKNFERTKIVKIFQDLEFKSLLNRLPQKENADQDSLFEISFKAKTKKGKKIAADHQIIKSRADLQKLISKLEKSKGFVVDTETDKLDAIYGKLIGISFSLKAKQAFYVPLVEDGDRDRVLRKLKPVLENPKIAKYGHNLKYDYMILKRYGVEIEPMTFDTMIASYLINPHTRAHNLDHIAFVELGLEKIQIEELIGKGKEQKLLSEVKMEKVAEYSGEDSDVTFRLKEKFEPEIKKLKIEKLFYQIEMPLVKVLAEMELEGIKLDSKYLKKMSTRVGAKIESLKKKIYLMAGSKFNISSTQQLSKILFEDLKISTNLVKKTKTGRSTAASELEKLKGQHEIIDLIREYRELTKLKNTYLDALPKLVHPATGRLHTNFNQTITATGRLSSSNPNLQNIPIRTDLGQEIRKAFVADSNLELLSVDYSQIELRIMAHLSEDKKMIEAFKNNEDIHKATAIEIFSISDGKVTPEMRRIAKTVNFGVLYGISSYGLSQGLGIDQNEAQAFIDRYFQIYAGVQKYIHEIIEKTKKSGYVETLSGRRRYLPEINSGMTQVRKAAERMAVNMPCQGTAADIMKMAMIEISSKLKMQKLKLLLQVHDELVFEVPKNEVKKIAFQIKEILENIFKLKVPLKVDVKIGKNWQEMSELE